MRMHGIMFFTGTKWTRQTTRTGMRPNGVSPRLPLRKFFVTVTGAGGQSGGRRSTRTASGQAFSTQGVLTFPLLFWIKRPCRCRERLSPACARTCIGDWRSGARRTWELGSRNRHSHRAIPTKIHRPHRNTTHGHLRRARTQAAAGSPATPLRHGNGGKCFILAPPEPQMARARLCEFLLVS